MLKFAEAFLSETGGINGQKGDQANEIRISNIYEHNLGWRKFRYPDSAVAYWIGKNAITISQNLNFGYGQSDRVSGYNACKAAGWEPANVTTPCNLDCSEMVRTQIACALEHDIADFYTGNEAGVLLSLGFREVLNGSQEHGDIWVTSSTGHTGTIVEVGGDVSTNNHITAVYGVRTEGRVILPDVTDLTDYAGIEGKKITDLKCEFSDGCCAYQVHVLGCGWLPEVSGNSWNDGANGYAGCGKVIDAIKVRHTKGKKAVYRVSTTGSTEYLPWVENYTDYAGIYGKPIDKIQIYVK